MFAKVRCSKNIFLSIRMMFCSHLAYPKQVFAHTSKSKLTKHRIWQIFDRNRPKKIVITVVFGDGVQYCIRITMCLMMESQSVSVLPKTKCLWLWLCTDLLLLTVLKKTVVLTFLTDFGRNFAKFDFR